MELFKVYQLCLCSQNQVSGSRTCYLNGSKNGSPVHNDYHRDYQQSGHLNTTLASTIPPDVDSCCFQ
nr:unnamed protein product [Spirometra erinaceieuropaei]